MKKKLLIIGVVVAAALAIPSGIVLAQEGVEGFQAFVPRHWNMVYRGWQSILSSLSSCSRLSSSKYFKEKESCLSVYIKAHGRRGKKAG